ncbi:MAG: hypothetical protein AB1720_06585 [Pseudomonadota bacterium]
MLARPRLHPAARILLWVGWAVAVEAAAPSVLPLLAVAAATAFLFAPTRSQLLTLLRRTRWLLVALALAYAVTLPGVPAWPALGWASPSMEGLAAGGLRVARLALLLAGLAVLLALTARARLLYGLYVLTAPLAVLGLDRRAFVVRLGLVLDYVESAPAPARWLDALRAPLPEDAGPTTYPLETERWHVRDSAVILAGLLLLGIVLA